MNDERVHETATPAGHHEPTWWPASRRECRMLLFAADFTRAVEVAAQAADRARREGDERAWRRSAVQQALALNGACRFEESLALCDAVIASTSEAEDRGAVAHAWNTSATTAHRLSRDDTLRRLDAALAIGEWYLDERGRPDSLGRAAATAAALGLPELGDDVHRRVMAALDGGAAIQLPLSSILWIESQGATVRLWCAMALEFRDDPRAFTVYEDNLESLRAVLARLPAGPGFVGSVIAVLRAFEGHALVALGRRAEAREPLALAAATLRAESRDVFAAGVELACGYSTLRLGTVRGREAAELASRLVRLAQWVGDEWAEAEAWRLTAAAAAVDGNLPAHRVARGRFEAMAERLDWRYRLQSAELLTFRSRTLRRIVEGEDWLRPRPPSPLIDAAGGAEDVDTAGRRSPPPPRPAWTIGRS